MMSTNHTRSWLHYNNYKTALQPMVKENKLKLVSPTLGTKTKPIPVARSTVLSSIVISILVIASISAIGITIAYMLGYSTDMTGKCVKDVLAFEQKGYYPSLEEYKAASVSCIK